MADVSKFSERVSKTLTRVQYRRAETDAEKREIFRMRHDAYVRVGAVEPTASGLLTDRFDQSPNVWLLRVLIDGDLAGSIRFHLAASLEHDFPPLDVYPDVVEPYLRSGHRILYISRHVNKPEYSRNIPEMPLITMRPAYLAEQFFDLDYILGTSRAENQGAFKRMMGSQVWAEPRLDPLLAGEWALMAYDCKALRERTLDRYPFYRSSPEEQRDLFERSSNRAGPGLEMFTRTKDLYGRRA